MTGHRNVNKKRFDKTLAFFRNHYMKSDKILDLGIDNELSKLIRKEYDVVNTNTDLDVDYDIVKQYDTLTAFEIFEHMFAPFNLLNAAKGKLIASVPLRIPMINEYWNYEDKLDCHYHEFSIRQFNHLLERTGWTIKDSETHKAPINKIGIRPLLRLMYSRYYFVYAEKDLQ